MVEPVLLLLEILSHHLLLVVHIHLLVGPPRVVHHLLLLDLGLLLERMGACSHRRRHHDRLLMGWVLSHD